MLVPSARLRTSLVLFLAAALAGAPACSSDSGAGGDDSGAPVDAGGDIGLDFTPGDVPDEDNPSGTLGADCDSEFDCTEGEVCVGADPANGVSGYCSILDCVDSTECDFGIEGETFCCSDFGTFRGCFQEGPEAVCGDESGEQGDDCSQGGQSDCVGENHFCIELYGGEFCAQTCDPRQPAGCGADAWCFPTGNGGGLCVPAGDTDELEPCAADPGSCAPGSLCDGAFQDPVSGTAYCAQTCQSNPDCLAGEWCRRFPGQNLGTCLPIGDAAEGESCTEDRWSCAQDLYCLNEGTRVARCTSLCERQTDCPDDHFCSFFSDDLGTCNRVGDGQTGTPCGDDFTACVEGAFCIGFQVAYNPDAYCSEDCSVNPGTCGEGFFCQNVGDGQRFCLPDGPGSDGDPCDSTLDCDATSECLYTQLEGQAREGECRTQCGNGVSCDGGEWCTGDDEGFCLDDGPLDPGDPCADSPFDCPEDTFCGSNPAICIQSCDEDPEACPSGFYCTEDNGDGNRFCLPFGSTADGQPCTESGDCVEGSFCQAQDDDDNGLCSPACLGDGDCPNGSWCLRGADAGVCLPDGDQGTNQSCAADRFDCASGNVCLFAGTDDAFCSRDCTGFATRCGNDEVCRLVADTLTACIPVGETAAGGSCADDANACDASSVCVGAGTETAACAELCTFDSSVCDEETQCARAPSGFGACLPPGQSLDASPYF